MRIDGYCTLGQDREFDLTAEALLRAMDAAGVDRAVIAPPDRHLAVLNREGNAAMLRAARAYPERFIPCCSVNPWYGNMAGDELKRAVEQGARMLVLHPFVQGYLANDELVWPILDIAARKKIPVYIHTGLPGNSTPWQIVDLAEQFPGVDFIMGHCGATDFWNDVVESVKAVANVYLEASLARPFSFAGYVKTLGKTRCIMGSFAPINEFTFEWDQIRRVLPDAEWPDVYGNNLLRLLVKSGAL